MPALPVVPVPIEPEQGGRDWAGLIAFLVVFAVVAGIAYWIRHRRPPPGRPHGPSAPPPAAGTPIGPAGATT